MTRLRITMRLALAVLGLAVLLPLTATAAASQPLGPDGSQRLSAKQAKLQELRAAPTVPA
jgi:outer membrane lipoprotein-sorting protein